MPGDPCSPGKTNRFDALPNGAPRERTHRLKTLLVNPPPGRKELPLYPLGLAAIAASLRGGEVRGCDLQLARDPEAALGEALRAFEPDVVAVALRNVDSSASYDRFFYYPAFVSVVRQIRRQCPRARLVVGGPGFSLFVKTIMEDLPEIDFGVQLEGEISFPELLAHLDTPAEVPGIAYRENGAVRLTAQRTGLAVTELPLPDHTIFPPAAYAAQGAAIGVQTKRGCAFRCIYCTYPYLDGEGVRQRPPEVVADELSALAGQGVSRVFFCDSIFNFPPEHAAAICRAIIQRGLQLRWRAFFNERFVTEEQIALCKAAGCELFIFGPDAGHAATLAQYHKDFDLARMAAAYDICRRLGVKFKCAFMMNGPGETLVTMTRMLAFIARLRLRSPLAFSLSTMRLYPHTELHAEAIKRGLVRPEDRLLTPRFYDPMPLRFLTSIISGGEKLVCTLQSLVSS